MKRILRLTFKPDEELLAKNKPHFKDRNLVIEYVEGPTHLVTLIGYDGEDKYSTTTLDQPALDHIYTLIDSMPMRRIEMARKMARAVDYMNNQT